MAEERSVSDVFQDILRNLQEMVRSEIRLAKVEIRGEVKQAVSSAVWVAAGGVAAMSAWIPFGAAMNKGITFRMGQTHVPRYTKPSLDKIQSGAIDPSFVITHRVPLADAPAAYKTFRDKEDGCIKVVLKP